MSPATFTGGTRPADISPLLDEHHLVVLSDEPAARTAFGRAMGDHLSGFTGAQLIDIDGLAAPDLDGFTSTLHAALGGRRSSDLYNTVARLLRSHPERGQVRMRYIVWNDADEMLERDVSMFSKVVSILLAVAAEHEHSTPDPVIMLRSVFLGGSKLGAYAEEESGQFRRWMDWPDAPYGPVARWLPSPPVLVYRIGG